MGKAIRYGRSNPAGRPALEQCPYKETTCPHPFPARGVLTGKKRLDRAARLPTGHGSERGYVSARPGTDHLVVRADLTPREPLHIRRAVRDVRDRDGGFPYGAVWEADGKVGIYYLYRRCCLEPDMRDDYVAVARSVGDCDVCHPSRERPPRHSQQRGRQLPQFHHKRDTLSQFPPNRDARWRAGHTFCGGAKYRL